MDSFGSNPFAVLTFIAAPAVLTNASSVMALGTSNRFARAVDRVRTLAAQIAAERDDADREALFRMELLDYAERRALLLVRALTGFYLSVGSFAAASLTSLLGATFAAVGHGGLRNLTLVLALVAGTAGIGGLVYGASILVRESRLTLGILALETEHTRRRLHRRAPPPPPPPSSP